MFSPQLAPPGGVRTWSGVRRISRKEPNQPPHPAREDSVAYVAGRQAREDSMPLRTRKMARKEENGSSEKVKKDESVVWVRAGGIVKVNRAFI